MVDFSHESPLTLAEAAKTVPGNVNPATIWRWAHKGVRGLRLEAQPVGGRWFTSQEAVSRFLNALAVRAGQQVTPTESAARKSRVAKATRALIAKGC